MHDPRRSRPTGRLSALVFLVCGALFAGCGGRAIGANVVPDANVASDTNVEHALAPGTPSGCEFLAIEQAGGHCEDTVMCEDMQRDARSRQFECNIVEGHVVAGGEFVRFGEAESAALVECAARWLHDLDAADVVVDGTTIHASGTWEQLLPLTSVAEVYCRPTCNGGACDYCYELDEGACDGDGFCVSRRGTPVDLKAGCALPEQFATCVPNIQCEAIQEVTLARDETGACWYFSRNCGDPGFAYVPNNAMDPDCAYQYYPQCADGPVEWQSSIPDGCEFLREGVPGGNCSSNDGRRCEQMRADGSAQPFECEVVQYVMAGDNVVMVDPVEVTARAACTAKWLEALGASDVSIEGSLDSPVIRANGTWAQLQPVVSVAGLMCNPICVDTSCDQCYDLDETDCGKDAFCDARRGSPVDLAVGCLLPEEFLGCRAAKPEICSDSQLLIPDDSGVCWSLYTCTDLSQWFTVGENAACDGTTNYRPCDAH